MSTYISKTARSPWARQLSRRTGCRLLRYEGAILQSSPCGQRRGLGTEAAVAPANKDTILDEAHHLVGRHVIESNAAKEIPPKYEVNERRHSLVVRVWKQSQFRSHDFHFYFLRDACSCAKCVDPSTKQKNFQTSDIPLNILIKRLTTQENGDVLLEWGNDVKGFGPDHITTFPSSFFKQNWSHLTRVLARYDDNTLITWGKHKMESAVKWFPYDSYMSSDATLHSALMHLARYGLIFLSDVPSTEKSVVNIGTRIGPLRDSFYGRTWDVKSVPDAKNVAYTHQHLGLHMDLLYMQNPPGLQLLHCLRATCAGGNSLFSDSYRAAMRMQARSPALFDALLTFPVTYHYRNAGQHYHYTRETVEMERYTISDRDPRIAAVNWSPPFQAPFEVNIGAFKDAKGLRAYMTAAKLFAKMVEDEDALFELKLEEGQCVVFNNRRVLHARRAFDVGKGERWLKGAYVDSDVFLSKLRVLRGEFGGPLSSLGVRTPDIDALRAMQDDQISEESGEEREGEEEARL